MPKFTTSKVTFKQIYYYTVEGFGDFPTDMLRYDMAWPKEEAPMLRRDGRYRVQISGLNPPTEGRWESFLWKVLPLDEYGRPKKGGDSGH